MIIDIHMHLPYHRIFPAGFIEPVALALAAGDSSKLPFTRKLVRANLADRDGSTLKTLMDQCGIQRSVLLIADFGVCHGEAECSLEEIFSVHRDVLAKYPDRFIVFGGVDPRRGRAGVDLFERSIKSYGFAGLKLYPPCGFEMDDEGLYPLYELCSAHGLPVLSHTGPSWESMRTEREYPRSVLRVSEEFPKINFILGHGGARDWRSNVDVAKARKNVFLEVSTFQKSIREERELDDRFRYFFDHIPDQILFGSDWPMFALGSTLQNIIRMVRRPAVLKDDEQEKFLFGNAHNLLKL
jgi:predicted TIM-barrel fold metal-dependent hydrolase